MPRKFRFDVIMIVPDDDQTDPEDMVEIITEVLHGRRLADYSDAIEDTIEEARPTWTVRFRMEQ